MLFASFDFLLFFLPVLFGYWALARRPRARWLLLLVASYFFYCASAKPMAGGPSTPWYFVGLVALSTLVDYVAAIVIAARPNSPLIRDSAFVASLGVNLGLLGYFKYTGFLFEVATSLSDVLGGDLALPTLRTVLPIGISFYTFQSLSYTIDVWRGKLLPEKNLLRFSLFVSFFPQLVAGPIVRATEFLPQLSNRLKVDIEDVNFAVFRISKGLLKKVILGDLIAARFTDIVFSTPDKYSSLENLVALYAFTLQIYADFSGYSDIAIGTARLLGFQLPENFDRPYQARDVGEFWRRWHMTLSTWLRDYVFFPLGGSRLGPVRTYFNLWLTMFLVGMWHGASWTFLIYSNLHALAMIYSRFNRQLTEQKEAIYGVIALIVALLTGFSGVGLGLILDLGPESALLLGAFSFGVSVLNGLLPMGTGSRFWAVFHIVLTFHFSTLSRVFFRADSLSQASQMVRKLVEWDGLGVRTGLFRLQGVSDLLVKTGIELTPLTWVADWGLLLLLVGGLSYHFLPARLSESIGLKVVKVLPAPALAVGLASCMVLISQLLTGPRANIYFSF